MSAIDAGTLLQAVATVVVVFLGMRTLYGSWPWEGHKTWYATRQLALTAEEEEGISLNPEQIAHAIASAASVAQLQPENAKTLEKSQKHAGLAQLPSNVDLAAQRNAA